ncbi:hypothetical protein [Halovivax limisalsi]|uniref:hypothetical protein n=1 Tax=Halovivax limisalsi TaxID=1453760 RepID=UPI001FFC5188|nr:hypothetical protein [Halovivax limisalsi]
MTDNSISATNGAGDDSRSTAARTGDSRRSLKKGALASAALAVGASGTAAAQDDGDGLLDDDWDALIHITNFNPDARFAFVSGVVDWKPNYGAVTDSWFADYNTHQIRWLNTGEVVPLFVAHDTEIGEYDEDIGFVPDTDDGNQPQLFQMNKDWSPFGDNQEFIAVEGTPVEEEDEDSILEHEDWWQTNGNGGGNENGGGNGGGNETGTGNETG